MLRYRRFHQLSIVTVTLSVTIGFFYILGPIFQTKGVTSIFYSNSYIKESEDAKHLKLWDDEIDSEALFISSITTNNEISSKNLQQINQIAMSNAKISIYMFTTAEVNETLMSSYRIIHEDKLPLHGSRSDICRMTLKSMRKYLSSSGAETHLLIFDNTWLDMKRINSLFDYFKSSNSSVIAAQVCPQNAAIALRRDFSLYLTENHEMWMRECVDDESLQSVLIRLANTYNFKVYQTPIFLGTNVNNPEKRKYCTSHNYPLKTAISIQSSYYIPTFPQTDRISFTKDDKCEANICESI
ncbi:hypothetical protein TVAG_249750 [Trichomonas vaginalis G3]|uniref:Nucleotide-diphospho-sugar transferase domain-containing protein n=1 Tax=Trichomonas vaginalis (strain ATCC PRA-98 / G3) TaxID=412133 RepID=A2DCH8_TRIV3|nr:hypothetical protein TVAGG3_0956710 [Trichomonas vaginalis G3]EAY21915.1 hypothetical protein TVAG_249750 [Trichomonas vaginalis G3]KAI5487611.1 hypothetical protein TVAGG3_0956710 [Trichomonas vaginalis G3]|eukprot:XP_001582901.1 hypothetical protein [Trichomonas vaginalis G3]